MFPKDILQRIFRPTEKRQQYVNLTDTEKKELFQTGTFEKIKFKRYIEFRTPKISYDEFSDRIREYWSSCYAEPYVKMWYKEYLQSNLDDFSFIANLYLDNR